MFQTESEWHGAKGTKHMPCSRATLSWPHLWARLKATEPLNTHTVKPAIPLSTRRRPPRAHALTKQQTSWTPVSPPQVAQGRLVGLKEPDYGRLSSFTLLLGGPWASVQGNRLSFLQLRWGKCFKQKVSGMGPKGPSICPAQEQLSVGHTSEQG